MRETLVRSLGWKYLLEKGKAIHSSILAWRIPWTVLSMGSQSWTRLSDFHFHFGRQSVSGKKKKIAKANSVSWYNINNNFLGIKDRTYSPLSLGEGGWADIKKQPLIDIHDQAVRGFDFFPPGEQTKNLPGEAFRAEPRELRFLPLVLPEPPPRPCPASWMDEPIGA